MSKRICKARALARWTKLPGPDRACRSAALGRDGLLLSRSHLDHDDVIWFVAKEPVRCCRELVHSGKAQAPTAGLGIVDANRRLFGDVLISINPDGAKLSVVHLVLAVDFLGVVSVVCQFGAISLQHRFDHRLFGLKVRVLFVIDCVCNLLMDLGPEIGRALVVSGRCHLGNSSVRKSLYVPQLVAYLSHLVPGQRCYENNWPLLIPICFRLLVFFGVEREDRSAIGILRGSRAS